MKLLCFVPLVFAYFQVIGILTDYGICWALNEGEWRPQVVAWGFPDTFSALGRAFNWPLFEYEPRFSRPIASLFELIDVPFRAMLWHTIPPHPALSLTWITSLLVGPLLLFALLRLLKISSAVAAFATALYVANPGVLSLEVLHFRSAKPLANVAILFCLWLAGIQNALLQKGVATDRQMTWRFGVLCFIAFVCLFSDEVALIVYPAIAILFPRIVFRTRLTMMIFALIPIAYVVSVAAALPHISELAGYPPPPDIYGPNVSVANLLTFRASVSSYFIIFLNVCQNSWLIVADTFGLINPMLPNSPLYFCYFFLLMALGGVFIAWVVYPRVLYRVHAGFHYARASGSAREEVRPRLVERLRNIAICATPLTQASIMLVMALIFEGFLMTVSIGGITLRAWGLYYYGVFCVIFVLIAISQLVESTKPSHALTMVFALTVVAATTLIFPATNQAYKAFHYYRLSAHPEDDLEAVFQNTINRFGIPTLDSNVLHEKTLALWRARAPQAVQDVPVELTYVVYELGLARSHTGCEFRTTRFDLVWNIQGDAEIICHD